MRRMQWSGAYFTVYARITWYYIIHNAAPKEFYLKRTLILESKINSPNLFYLGIKCLNKKHALYNLTGNKKELNHY